MEAREAKYLAARLTMNSPGGVEYRASRDYCESQATGDDVWSIHCYDDYGDYTGRYDPKFDNRKDAL